MPAPDGEEEEETALEYARSWGLSNTLSATQPLQQLKIAEVESKKTIGEEWDIWDDEGLPAGAVAVERLLVSMESMCFLQQVIRPEEPPRWYDMRPVQRNPDKCTKFELPLLYTDDELDLVRFGGSRTLDLGVLYQCPGAVPREESDEEISSPPWAESPPSEPIQLSTEKLECSKDGVRYLLGILKSEYGPTDEEEVLAHEVALSRRQRATPLSPLLLPIGDAQYTPDPFPVDQLDQFSEQSGFTSEEIEAIEQDFVNRDRLARHGDGFEDQVSKDSEDVADSFAVCSPLPSFIESLPSPIPRKRSYSSLRVEEPLAPGLLSPTAVKKIKSLAFAAPERECVSNLSGCSSEADRTFFTENIEPMVLEEERRLLQEHLLATDATGRVPIPPLVFYSPVVPWRTSSTTVREEALKEPHVDLQRWTGVSKLDRNLAWSAFALDIGKVSVDEPINDLNYLLNNGMADTDFEDVVVSDSLVWKHQGLRVLSGGSETEEVLEPCPIQLDEAEKDIDFLIRTRRAAGLSRLGQDTASVNAPQRSVSIIITPEDDFSASRSLTSDNGVMNGGLVSVASAITRFLQTRSQQHSSVTAAPLKWNHVSKFGVSTSVTKGVQRREIEAEHGEKQIKPYTPRIPEDPPAKTFIISLSLLTTHRQILRRIKQLYPNVDLVERSADIVHDKVAMDADILLSPATGVVLTTLQTIKQKPLPGHRATTGIKERLVAASARQERLLCLISEDAKEGTRSRSLDERDCGALAELSAYATVLDSDVQTMYIPGSENELATWIVSCMLQFGTIPGTKLSTEETTWEVTLRRCGLNPFAAQLIISNLREVGHDVCGNPSSASRLESVASASDYGLRAFMRMTPQEREVRFEALLGGRRVMRRVNAAIEKRWPSAADGYACAGAPQMPVGLKDGNMLL